MRRHLLWLSAALIPALLTGCGGGGGAILAAALIGAGLAAGDLDTTGTSQDSYPSVDTGGTVVVVPSPIGQQKYRVVLSVADEAGDPVGGAEVRVDDELADEATAYDWRRPGEFDSLADFPVWLGRRYVNWVGPEETAWLAEGERRTLTVEVAADGYESVTRVFTLRATRDDVLWLYADLTLPARATIVTRERKP